LIINNGGGKMKKLLILAMMLGLLVGGCIGATGWIRNDGQPLDQAQFEKDREECNRGWEVAMTTDILFTGFILSAIHYTKAKNCMTAKGYIELIKYVVVAPKGKYYHLPNCEHISRVPNQYLKQMTYQEAETLGYNRCPSCFPSLPKSK
jgi:hypothetical protein